MNVGNAESAYDCFVESLQHEPYHLVTILQLVEASYYLKRFDDLERVLRIYSNAKPQDVEMKFCLAGACFKLNKLEEAKALCEQVLKIKPNHVGAMQVNQEIDRLFTENDLQATQQITANTPTEIIETQYHPNIAPAGSQRTNKESVPLVQVVATRETDQQIDPRSNAKLDSLVTPLSAVDMEIMGIEEAKRRKKYDEVLQRVADLKQRTEITGVKGELLRLVEAEVRGLKGDLNFAKTVFDDVLKANPQSARALCGKGALAAHAADWFQARNYFTQALTFEPRNDVAFAGLGLCSVCENKQEDAWEYYSKSLAINPENLRAILGIIELGYAFNRLDVMESAITNYLEMHPADIDMLYSLAGCFYKQGRFDEAMEQLDRILLFRPNHDLALELREVIINAENSEHTITEENTENAGISE
jgi:tetratricopeptide (TPR) repeat protein